MEELWTLFWIFAILVVYSIYWYISVPKSLPPGSAGIPFFGCLPFVGQNPFQVFQNFANKYGNVFHLYLGSRLVVVLNDYEAIKEAFFKQAEIFAGRPPDGSFHTKPNQNFGITFTDGEHWKQHRRFLISNLRDYGVGKLILEPIILNEIQFFVRELKKHTGECFPIKSLLSPSLVNNILILIRGKRFEYDDPLLKQFSAFLKNIDSIPQLDLFMFFPSLIYFPGIDYFTKKHTIRRENEKLYAIVKDILKDVQKESEGGRGFYMNAYAGKKVLEEKLDDNEYKYFTDIGLLHITRDLLFAGSETSSLTLHWGLLYMTKYPEIQTKVQEEIDRVIGREREPSFTDRNEMPYVQATILEIHRYNSLGPLAIPHRNIKSTNICGHFIPKDTVIFASFWAVHNDVRIWGDPQNFRPERFLSPEGKFIKSEHVINFSMGKRACAGESLAKMEIFLYFVSLLQHFSFVPPNGVMPTLEAYNRILRRPICTNICAVLRD